MCLALRYTDSRGRSGVPKTLLRMWCFRLSRRTAFALFLSAAISRQPREPRLGPQDLFEAPVDSQFQSYFAPAPANALPGLILTTSPSYRIPLPLYGSGLRILRMSLANCPTACLSAPLR